MRRVRVGDGMSRFKRRAKAQRVEPEPEHAVMIHFSLSGNEHGTVAEREAIFELENAIESIIETQALGEFDGNEFGGGEAVVYCYGPDAGRLFAGIEETVRAFPARPAHVLLRFGDVNDENAVEQRIDL